MLLLNNVTMNELYFPIVINNKPFPFNGVRFEGNIALRSKYLIPNTHAQFPIRWDMADDGGENYYWNTRWWTGAEAIKAKNCTLGIGTCGCPEYARLYPEWKSSQPKPEFYQRYANFVLAICEEHDPSYIEVWNEPDVDKDYLSKDWYGMGAWGDEDDEYYGGRAYGDLLSVVYPAIKSKHPNIQIVAGALLLPMDGSESGNKQDKFIQGVMLTGENCFDIVSFHCYSKYPDTRWDRFIAKMIYLHGITGKPTLMSETSLLADADCVEFREQQALYYEHIFKSQPHTSVGFMWYTLANNGWMNSDMVLSDVKQAAWYKYEECTNGI